MDLFDFDIFLNMNIVLLQVPSLLLFVSILFLHIVKRNVEVAFAYGLQSLVIVALFVGLFLETGKWSFFVLACIGFIAKVIMAPMFMIHLVKKFGVSFLVSSYATAPVLLVVVAALTAFAHSDVLSPLVMIVPEHRDFAALALSSVFVSLFLIMNRKGAISQIAGILSLENSIVAFGLFSLVSQSLILEIGTIFAFSVWVIIATTFTAMMYSHFGSLDVTQMKHLRD